MPQSYLIVVDNNLLTGSVEMQLASYATTYSISATGTFPSRIAEVLPTEFLLSLRHNALTKLSEAIAKPNEDIGSADSVPAYAALAFPKQLNPASHSQSQEGIKILEGVGAIIAKEDVIDVEQLNATVGLTVFENIEIPSVNPENELKGQPLTDDALPNRYFRHLEKIGLSSGDHGGEGIVVGILDSGIHSDHSEFAEKNITFQEFDGVGDEISGPVRDAGSHGTHVSSIVAGNRLGVAPQADLAVAAVLTRRDATGAMVGELCQIAAGMDWLIKTPFDHERIGADVINVSLGDPGYHNYFDYSVQSALDLGIPMIAAIGNGGQGNHSSPGNYANTLSVGATTYGDQVASTSSWAEKGEISNIRYPLPDLSAPGIGLYGALPDGGYGRKSGTSQATPVVTGVAARRMQANSALLRHPCALFLNLLSTLHPINAHDYRPNFGGAGRIRA